jgi:hypothetical protein
MREARIQCLCYEHRLDDLGVALRKGEVRWLTEAQVRSSADLRLAERSRAVSVRWQERCAVEKPSPRPVDLKPRASAAPAGVRPKRAADEKPVVPVAAPPAPVAEPAPAPAPVQAAPAVAEEVETLRVVRRGKKKEQ